MRSSLALRWLAGLGSVALVLAALLWWLNVRGEDELVSDPASFQPTSEQIDRGAYLAKAGNCMACHTARGEAAFSGGKGIETPFGIVYASNITPDAQTGIGNWSADHFWRAMHHGRSKDGRLLYPAFPYVNYTLVTREDSDALLAYLRSQQPVRRPNLAHKLRFPYDSQAALAVWRALSFSPGRFEPDVDQSPEWNRGAYLVRGLGHCNACHAPRNALGATSEKLELSGGLIPMQNWYAPSLGSAQEAGVADWSTQEVLDLLRTGVSSKGSVMGPMAEVVFRSTQHLSEPDLRAMAVFLKALPPTPYKPASRGDEDNTALMAQGGQLYGKHCAACHGSKGEGAGGFYPALAGNRAVLMDPPVNLVRIVMNGGFLPATQGNPRPFGMPPFAHVLDDAEVSAVLSYIRGSWGNKAARVGEVDMVTYRKGR